jgi:hypothetical protein
METSDYGPQDGEDLVDGTAGGWGGTAGAWRRVRCYYWFTNQSVVGELLQADELVRG